MKDDRKDLIKQIKDLKVNIKIYQQLLQDASKQITYWKHFWYEDQSNKNLLQGYKKVIVDLSDKLRRKES